MNRGKSDKITRFLIIFAAFCLVAMTGYQVLIPFLEKQTTKPTFTTNEQPENENQLVINNQVEERINNEEKLNQEIEIIKDSVTLKVPFMPQAPDGVWDELHNEACEEASLIILNAFLKDEELDKERMEKEIQALVDWQIKNWGEHKDLTLRETAEMAKEYYGYQWARVVKNITTDDIKKELSLGNPVILPLAGREIKNPYYRRPGPYYHMLVVTGYDKSKFITNDPGTRRGEHYVYDQNLLFSAIHDWPGKEKDILAGQKAMLIIEK